MYKNMDYNFKMSTKKDQFCDPRSTSTLPSLKMNNKSIA